MTGSVYAVPAVVDYIFDGDTPQNEYMLSSYYEGGDGLLSVAGMLFIGLNSLLIPKLLFSIFSINSL